MWRQALAATVVAIAISACGGADSAETTTTAASAEPTTSTTTAATTTTAAATTTEATTTEATTTTTEPLVTFASLSPYQQEVVDRICKAAVEGDLDLVGDVTILQVLSGEAGLPALEDAWAEYAQDPAEWDARLAAAAPICDDIGWVPLS